MYISKKFQPLIFVLALLLYVGCDSTDPSISESSDSLIGVRWNGSQEEVISINDKTGETTTLATVNLKWFINNNFVYDPGIKRAFILGQRENDPDSLSWLYTVDVAQGAVSEVLVSKLERRSIKFRTFYEGRLLGYRGTLESKLDLLYIDPETGVIDVFKEIDLASVYNGGFELEEERGILYIMGIKNFEDRLVYIYTIDLDSNEVGEVLLSDQENIPFVFASEEGQLLGYRAKEDSNGRFNQLVTEIVEINPGTGHVSRRAVYEFNGGLNQVAGLTPDRNNLFTLGRLNAEAPIRLYFASLEEGSYRSVVVDNTGRGGFFVVGKN